MISVIVAKLMKLKLERIAYFILSVASVVLGRFSRFKLVDNEFWVQKQGATFFVDLFPDYRLKESDVQALCEDVFFNSYTPKTGDVCIDIGAGVGFETRIMSELTSADGRIFSIEASPKTYKALELCIKYNDLKNVSAHNYAVSNENGTVFITDNIENHIENSLLEDGCHGGCEVKGITIDDYIDENGITSIDYMKVNIEGAEKLMIQTFEKIGMVKHIAVSTHDFLGRRKGDKSLFTREAIVEFLEEKNFEVYTRSTNVDYKDDWVYGRNKAFQD